MRPRMKRVCAAIFVFVTSLSLAWGQAAESAASQEAANTAAAAAVASGHADTRVPDFAEHIVDEILALFDVRTTENTWQRYAIAGGLLVVFYLLRRVVTLWIFGLLNRLSIRTATKFDDRLFPALERPVTTSIALIGFFLALKVLKLSESGNAVLGVAMTVAFSLCFFWALIRALGAFLDHLADVARERQVGVAAFMPWIKKSLITLFAILAVLMIAQSLGANVKAFLAGLGLGGLAFALAAQDTIANLFGSVVVAIDQPFKIGDAVRIGPNDGVVEDIGLRSTKVRRADRSVVIIPNKAVAAEAITNNSRINARRHEQVLGINYDATPGQMAALVEEIRGLILAEEEIDPKSVMVFFRDLNVSSLDIWVVYMTRSADFAAFMRLRQRLNIAFMKAVAARGLSFAFPRQTLDLGSGTVQALAPGKDSRG